MYISLLGTVDTILKTQASKDDKEYITLLYIFSSISRNTNNITIANNRGAAITIKCEQVLAALECPRGWAQSVTWAYVGNILFPVLVFNSHLFSKSQFSYFGDFY